MLVLFSSLISYMWHLQEKIHFWKLPEVQNLGMLKPVFKNQGGKQPLGIIVCLKWLVMDPQYGRYWMEDT